METKNTITEDWNIFKYEKLGEMKFCQLKNTHINITIILNWFSTFSFVRNFKIRIKSDLVVLLSSNKHEI